MAEVLQWKKDKGADKEVGIPNNNAQQSKSKRVVSLKGGFAGLRGIKTKSSTLAMQQLRKVRHSDMVCWFVQRELMGRGWLRRRTS